MSAVRNTSNRAEARKKRALPYSRSIVKSILRVFGYGEEDDQPELPVNTQSPNRPATDRITLNSPARPQDHAFQGTSNQSTFSSRQPLVQVDYSNLSPRRAMDPPSSSTVADARSVANYFTQKTGTPIDTSVVESMVADLQTTPEKNQKFRFTFTTPGPESSPFSSNTTFAANTPQSTPSSSAKKLSRNPNGTYRWEGAGSAKHARPRNRYASPAFGASPSKSERLVMKESNGTGETDHKRRRVDEMEPSTSRPAAAESSAPSVLPFPISGSPTPPRVSPTPAKPATVSSSSRLRTPAKPTAPVVPSPLRQAWSDASPTSSREEPKQSPTQQPRPTKTANFMAELIKETTPPKKPDLSNPYQAASPVGKVGPPRRAKRTRATGRPPVPTKEVQAEEEKRKEEEKKQKEKEKLDEYSPQAIIEATLPKGSKRSRPPAHFEKPVSEPNAFLQISGDVEKKYVVEEPEDEGSSRSAKRSKPTLNGNGRPSTFFEKASTPPPEVDIRIEEIDEVVVHETNKDQEKIKTNGNETVKPTNGNPNVFAAAAAANTNGSTSRSSFSALKSIPKEPSKLRFSFQADAPSSPAVIPAPLPQPTTTAAAAAPKPFVPPSGDFNFSFKPSNKENAKIPETAAELEKDIREVKPLTTEEIKSHVGAVAVNSLPTFNFTFTEVSVLSSSADHVRARSDVKVLPPSSLPTFDFAKPNAGSPSGFKFELAPSKSSPACHDTPKPSPRADIPPVKSFDFAAAGMKPEPKKDIWSCSVCYVANPTSASQCIACENPALASVAAAPKPAVKGFDFAAAGFKMPTPNKDTWTCSECFLSNPNSATKCVTCEADRR